MTFITALTEHIFLPSTLGRGDHAVVGEVGYKHSGNFTSSTVKTVPLSRMRTRAPRGLPVVNRHSIPLVSRCYLTWVGGVVGRNIPPHGWSLDDAVVLRLASPDRLPLPVCCIVDLLRYTVQ